MKYVIYNTTTGDIIHAIALKNVEFNESKYCLENQSYIEIEDDIKISGKRVDIINKTLIDIVKPSKSNSLDIKKTRDEVEKYKRYESNPILSLDHDDVDAWVDTNVKNIDDIKKTLCDILKLVCKPVKRVTEQHRHITNNNDV